jgi:hypothetical protein
VNGNLVGNNFTITQIRYRDIARSLTSVFEQNNNLNDFSIYPNPVSSELIIDDSINTVEVFDMNGKLVLSKELSAMPDTQKKLMVSNLTQGLYHLKGSSKKGTVNFKFLKQ